MHVVPLMFHVKSCLQLTLTYCCWKVLKWFETLHAATAWRISCRTSTRPAPTV